MDATGRVTRVIDEDAPFHEVYTFAQIESDSAKRIQQFTCRNCGKQKEYDREYIPLCEQCAENLREKAESYGGESWEIGQRLKSYTDEINEKWKNLHGN